MMILISLVQMRYMHRIYALYSCTVCGKVIKFIFVDISLKSRLINVCYYYLIWAHVKCGLDLRIGLGIF